MGAGVVATETAASFPDWSLFPLDPLLVVMAALEAPDLVRAGAACSSWHAAYATVRRHRIPTAESTPCLFYTRADGDPDTATIYSPASGASFRVRMPDLSLRRWSFHGSSHGWLIAADELSNLHLVNPLTGTRHALPPITALHPKTEAAATDKRGNPTMYNVWEYKHHRTPMAYTASELRLTMYFKAELSCSPSAGRECVVLLLHTPDGELSFARLGDKDWTFIGEEEKHEQWLPFGYRDAVYNNKDGLFYVLGCGADIITMDFNSTASSPVVKRIMKDVTMEADWTKYIAMAPWGDLLQVWRMTDDERSATTPVQAEEWMDSDVKKPYHEQYTTEIQLYRVDIANQKLVRITGLGDHALFLGLNSTMILSTKDLPTLKADCAYLAHDNCDDIIINTYNRKEIGVWKFTSGTLEDVDNVHPWRNWPVPIWITPSLS